MLLAVFNSLYSTHNRAGEITYEQIGPLKYKIKIITYTYTKTNADRCYLWLKWSDTDSVRLDRINGPDKPIGINYCIGKAGETLDYDIKKNIYEGVIDFSAPGSYVIWIFDRNRNKGVKNINQSVNIPFYIESKILIGAGIGNNTSPVLLNPPTDIGVINAPFVHSLAAYDSDGDSLSYKLVNCKGLGEQGKDEIKETYKWGNLYNLSLNTITVNRDGIITWDAPKIAGEYNIAIEITEHRKDAFTGKWRKIGSILRDMQIEIMDYNNTPPVIKVKSNFCVIAGKTIKENFNVSDKDDHNITVESLGELTQIKNKIKLTEVKDKKQPFDGSIEWSPECENVRKTPYSLIIKAQDHPIIGGKAIKGLSAQNIIKIKVVGDSPKLLTVTEAGVKKQVSIKWGKYYCSQIKGYNIYRKEAPGNYKKDTCLTGAPSGYIFVGNVKGIDNLEFVDASISYGKNYCYIITAVFDSDTESLASNSKCVQVKDKAVNIKKIIVNKTDSKDGVIDLEWYKPTYIESSLKGPYFYKIFYSDISNKDNFIELTTIEDKAGANTFKVKNIDTKTKSYFFKINFYNKKGANYNIISEGEKQSSSFLNIAISDKSLKLSLNQKVSWYIDSMQVFRQNKVTSKFEYIGRSDDNKFVDGGLKNNNLYCYRAKLFGEYVALKIEALNQSQDKCESPKDVGVECPPILSSKYECNKNLFILEWTPLKCADDIAYYKILYANKKADDFEVLDSLKAEDVVSGNFSYNTNEMDGCFMVYAVDNKGNESINSNVVCINPCPDIKFPNVFTPNDDGVNDEYIPMGVLGSKDYELNIYNRWGKIVFNTKKMELNWDGVDIHTGQDCSEGVYFYVATVRKNNKDKDDTENGIAIYSYKGYIHLFR